MKLRAGSQTVPVQSAPPVSRRRRLLLVVVCLITLTAIAVGGNSIRVEMRHTAISETLSSRLKSTISSRHSVIWNTVGKHGQRIPRSLFWCADGTPGWGVFTRRESHQRRGTIRLRRAGNLPRTGIAACRSREALPLQSRFSSRCMREDHPDSLLILEIIVPFYTNGFSVAKASEMLEIWNRREPNNPTPFIVKGDISKRLGRKSDTLASYAEACRLAPDDPKAHERLGEALVATKGFQEAIEHLQWLIQRGHAHRDVYLDTGTVPTLAWVKKPKHGKSSDGFYRILPMTPVCYWNSEVWSWKAEIRGRPRSGCGRPLNGNQTISTCPLTTPGASNDSAGPRKRTNIGMDASRLRIRFAGSKS